MVTIRKEPSPILERNRIVVRGYHSDQLGFNQIVGEDAAKYLLGQLGDGATPRKVSGLYQVVVTLRTDSQGNIEVLSLKIR